MSNTGEIISAIWDVAMLTMAIYMYRYARGFIKLHPVHQAKAIEFRKKNQYWLVPVSLLLAAIMVANIVLRFIN